MKYESTYCQTKETLWCGNDKRLAIIPLQLATEEMEILRWDGREDDMHVDIYLRPRHIRIVRELISDDQYEYVSLHSLIPVTFSRCDWRSDPVRRRLNREAAKVQSHFASAISL